MNSFAHDEEIMDGGRKRLHSLRINKKHKAIVHMNTTDKNFYNETQPSKPRRSHHLYVAQSEFLRLN